MKIINSQKFAENTFFISSLVFNISIAALYISVKFDSSIFLDITGTISILTIIPFLITAIVFHKVGASRRVMVSHIFILFYLSVEILFDKILQIPFREILWLHIIYILCFYAASFSMIGVTFRISKKKGLFVVLTFVILIFCLIYLYN